MEDVSDTQEMLRGEGPGDTGAGEGERDTEMRSPSSASGLCLPAVSVEAVSLACFRRFAYDSNADTDLAEAGV